MTLDEILKGESKNIEFKSELPKKSERYIKSIIAFANTSGGKLIIGIDDTTREIIGVNKEAVFQIMMALPMLSLIVVSLRLFQILLFRH